MAPVFEQRRLPAPGLGLQRLARIGAQARERRQIVGAGQHIDRVDLDHADLADHAAQSPAVQRPRRPRIGQPLSGDGDTPGLAGGEGLKSSRHPRACSGRMESSDPRKHALNQKVRA